ncbi:MAG: hypothetical protein Unbinned273contig1001_52 [Prokaryotic dsDNA virus sp.]|nr:MAG: hypothetical protein Unbinned273contig1001_52 [Prokaryotic dsDNA virus sp.]|tara:strand:+ start:3961 stop:5373 length:1413 start_codon:yes stop_codon:yes gene_type:complete
MSETVILPGATPVIVTGENTTEAARQAALATAEREAAELAAASAAAAGNYHPSVAAGEAATATDGLFSSDDGTGNLIYYRRTAGGSTEIGRAVTPSTLDDYAQRTGGETSVSGRYGFTNLSSFATAPEATVQVINDTVTTAGPAIGLNVKQYWQGLAASPLANNDCTLFETYTKTVDDSFNVTWSVSAPNAYYDIPLGVNDSGERISVYGWAVSVPGKPGYSHVGTLGAQKGVSGAVGFRGTHAATARVVSALAVVGEVESSSGVIENGYAGFFRSAVGDGEVLANTAVYAKATGGTNSNYSIYAEGGIAFFLEPIHIGNESGQTNALLKVRNDTVQGIEFGSVGNGYGSTIGSTVSGGFPFLAFNCEADTTGDTFRTRGFKGTVMYSPLNGSMRFARIPTASASGQGLDLSAQFTPNGNFQTYHNPIFGGVVPGSASATGTAGEIAWDSGYIYVCVAANTWKRAAISTW